MAERTQPPEEGEGGTETLTETLTTLRAKWGHPDGTITQCIENNGIYKYDADSELADDGDTVIRPIMTGAGRWIKVKEMQESTL